MKRYNCKNFPMEFYLDPDGYWVTYEEHRQDLDVFEAVLDKALEDVFDQKYMITDLREKLLGANKQAVKGFLLILVLTAINIFQYTGLIQ